jgi:hypothetical protein
MAQVFISYAHVHPDQELAAELHGFLETNGFDVFVDSKIGLGQNWVEQIDVQLRNSTHFVALLSNASIKSDMVRREIAIAYRLSKANRLVIFPVRLGTLEELPYELSAYLDLIQYTVWRPGESFNDVCQVIVNAIRAGAPLANNRVVTAPALKLFSEAELESLKSELARHLGPVARVVVDRAAKKAATWEQLCELLAAEIPAGEERRIFQARRRQ